MRGQRVRGTDIGRISSFLEFFDQCGDCPDLPGIAVQLRHRDAGAQLRHPRSLVSRDLERAGERLFRTVPLALFEQYLGTQAVHFGFIKEQGVTR